MSTCGASVPCARSVCRFRSSIKTLGCTFSWMYSGGACTTRSDQSCSSLPRQTNCGSRSRLRPSRSRGYETRTQFLPYQFKPVLQFLDSPSSGILIADEVGLGKTIEAGLIWTELRARQDARRLLVLCPAMLRDKWKMELAERFGVKADIVDAAELHARLQAVKDRKHEGFALIASVQGLRPSRGWNDKDEPAKSSSAELARFLDEFELDEPLLDLTIIDEAHYLRNQETQTYKLGALLRPVTLSMVMLSSVHQLLTRHQTGDWHELCKEDRDTNWQAALGDARVLSAFNIGSADQPVMIWIITEWDRSVTTILRPQDY